MLPVIYSPAPLAGGTAPITVAGHVAQGLAESLFGLVLHQARRAGSPFVIGMGPAVLDMATAQSSYNAPEYLQAYACFVEMARWLDLPNWGYGGTTDSQLVDAQAGMEVAELTLLSMLLGSNLNHDVGYLLGGGLPRRARAGRRKASGGPPAEPAAPPLPDSPACRAGAGAAPTAAASGRARSRPGRVP